MYVFIILAFNESKTGKRHHQQILFPFLTCFFGSGSQNSSLSVIPSRLMMGTISERRGLGLVIKPIHLLIGQR